MLISVGHALCSHRSRVVAHPRRPGCALDKDWRRLRIWIPHLNHPAGWLDHHVGCRQVHCRCYGRLAPLARTRRIRLPPLGVFRLPSLHAVPSSRISALPFSVSSIPRASHCQHRSLHFRLSASFLLRSTLIVTISRHSRNGGLGRTVHTEGPFPTRRSSATAVVPRPIIPFGPGAS